MKRRKMQKKLDDRRAGYDKLMQALKNDTNAKAFTRPGSMNGRK